nr:hypothetical protein [Kibdelosporangium sp. MJ126-NF4]CEL17419.1 hypothetical protein [Kibdelosporangium sp. MJ126-NF4]CTQ91354.1 hypothetical protein [Kibdelosporangium sp. MJ126-NF4]
MSVPTFPRAWHRPLMASTMFMVGLFLVSIVGLIVDDRVLLNESVWVKPLKFGFAFAVYGATLAWLLTKLHKAKRFGWWLGTGHAVFTALDVGAIALQAARGTFSHFNTDLDEPVNAVVLGILTYGVPPVLVFNLVIAILVLAQRVGDRAQTVALRVGLTLAIVGMSVPIWLGVSQGIKERTVIDANGKAVTMYTGHGIGDPDGTGMFLTNWSVTGGDMRVPHFVGMHGIHVLLLLTVILGALAGRYTWLRNEKVRSRLVGVAGFGYCGLMAILVWQAGRGQSLIHPDAQTGIAFAALVVVTAIAAGAVIASSTSVRATPEKHRKTAMKPR